MKRITSYNFLMFATWIREWSCDMKYIFFPDVKYIFRIFALDFRKSFIGISEVYLGPYQTLQWNYQTVIVDIWNGPKYASELHFSKDPTGQIPVLKIEQILKQYLWLLENTFSESANKDFTAMSMKIV